MVECRVVTRKHAVHVLDEVAQPSGLLKIICAGAIDASILHRFKIGQQRVSLNQLRKCLRLTAELTHIEDAVRIARHEIKGFHLHLPRAGFAGTQYLPAHTARQPAQAF